jgi:uncharacterized 2Fe-2S/4Fe-4S cluster protein (DUF4445 family)
VSAPGHTIHFLPDDRSVTVAAGTTLLEAAREAGVYVGAICSGEGLCGKCRVIVKEGEVGGESTEFLTRDEIRRGYALACQVVPKSDVRVEIPSESRLGGYGEIGADSERFRDFTRDAASAPQRELSPLVVKLSLHVPEPSLDDASGDHERVLRAIATECARKCTGPLQMGLKIIRDLPCTLRERDKSKAAWKWTWLGEITAAVGARSGVNEVLFVEPGDTSGRSYGLALDIGTTTVVAHLVDLTSGVTCEAAAKYNSQIDYGADVIARINAARLPGGAERLHKAVVEDVETLLEDLVKRAGIARGDVNCVIASGNTTMLHLLLGLEADLIRLSPFVPVATTIPPVRAAEIGIRANPRALLYAMPMVGSYVGGDITSGIIASGIHEADELTLLLDIGTNGEIVLGNKEFLVACSASAGPAFEGGQIKCGMRATAGAIDTVRIGADLSVEVSTIDDSPAVGLCGTGLVDALAQMFLAGIVDRNGRLQVDRCPGRFIDANEDGRPEFVLVSAKEAGGERDIVIDQADVDNLVRTKGAIYAAADSLVQSLGLTFDAIETVCIAGAFGNKLSPASCITIGLLPDVPLERIQFIGNSSVSGAKMAMLNRAVFEKTHEVTRAVTYQELMVDPGYMDKFTSACFLPHTDVSRFPSVQVKPSAKE